MKQTCGCVRFQACGSCSHTRQRPALPPGAYRGKPEDWRPPAPVRVYG